MIAHVNRWTRTLATCNEIWGLTRPRLGLPR